MTPIPDPDPGPGVHLPADATLDRAVGADLHAAGALRVRGDLIRCRTDVDGSVEVGGAVCGGALTTRGHLRCVDLGGGDGVTELWLGAPPVADRSVLAAGFARLAEAEAECEQRRELIRVSEEDPDAMDHEMREAMTLATFELPGLETQWKAIDWRIQKLEAFYEAGHAEISGRLLPGLVLRVGLRRQRFRCVAELHGPLRIEAFPEKQVILSLDAVDTRLDRHEAFEPIAASAPGAASATIPRAA